ncbi:GGDEF domain-containing phosphodiesterase [Salinicola sp. DM10]|uniref:GGDEF domain-containing phosphodiesterase n=1 Tax=Salinicola sp. DM10 TaxID=2815721 RepID=UPI001A9031FC|nr:GGDEF domain-containing phosphodiesterase [Salinicola sp. DM10]MCE3026729.1 EAL domain-containing protein [Salinicola sp. DM10]
MSASSEQEPQWRDVLVAQIDAIGNQLCQAVDGTFDFYVHTDSDEIAIQKLAQLNNFTLDAVRRTIGELEQTRRELEMRVEERTQRLNLILSATNDGVWEWEIDSGYVTLSPRWSRMLGQDAVEIRQPLESWLALIHPSDRSAVERAFYRHLDGLSDAVDIEYRLRNSRGAWRMMLCRGLCQRDDQGRALRMAGTLSDTTEQRLTDPLTGLPNGAYLELLMQERLHALPRPPLSLVKFQLLNVAQLFDGVSVEHAIAALRDLVQRLRRRLPARVALTALPEHTFAMVLELDAVAELDRVLEPVEALLAEPVEIEGRLVWLSHVSGVAIVNLHEAASADEWRRQARLALASARQSDVGTRCYYSESLRQWEQHQGRAEQMIRGALANRGVRCFLQPIVDIVAGTARGFEALMRLEDPVEGLVNPGAFVEVAERTGLIAPLWEMLMDQALPVLKDPGMRERFGETFLISINLSPRQLMDPGLLELMLAACARHGVAQSRLQVEVTESAVLSDPVRASRMLERMRESGIQVAMDDFGSGYSSLAQLTSLPLDTVKIDRSLVLDVNTLPRKQHVLAAVVALCQRLEHGVVVEGVEDWETVTLLRQWGVHDIQGFFYARPMPMAQLIKQFELPLPLVPSDDPPAVATR